MASKRERLLNGGWEVDLPHWSDGMRGTRSDPYGEEIKGGYNRMSS